MEKDELDRSSRGRSSTEVGIRVPQESSRIVLRPVLRPICSQALSPAGGHRAGAFLCAR